MDVPVSDNLPSTIVQQQPQPSPRQGQPETSGVTSNVASTSGSGSNQQPSNLSGISLLPGPIQHPVEIFERVDYSYDDWEAPWYLHSDLKWRHVGLFLALERAGRLMPTIGFNDRIRRDRRRQFSR